MKGLTNSYNRKINQGGIYCLAFQSIIVDELEQICFFDLFSLNLTQLILTYNYNALLLLLHSKISLDVDLFHLHMGGVHKRD